MFCLDVIDNGTEDFDSQTSEKTRIETKTDENGNVIRTEYDENGIIRQETIVNTNGQKSISKYEYDKNGKLKQITDVDSNNIVIHVFDEDERIIKSIHKHSDGSKYIAEYVYGENGKIKQDTTTWNDGLRIVRIYDEDEKIRKTTNTISNAELNSYINRDGKVSFLDTFEKQQALYEMYQLYLYLTDGKIITL